MNSKLKADIARRQECNRTIVKMIEEAIEKNPEMRFHQILAMLNLSKTVPVEVQGRGIQMYNEDRFYEESVNTLENIKML